MELLVVITIIVILTSAMIPVMSAASDSRRMREGARLVSTMLSSAQTRAMSSGRSVGVLFQPMKNNPYACMELYLVETPPPYSGDDIGDLATVGPPGVPPGGFMLTIQGPPSTPPSPPGTPTYSGLPVASQRLIRRGDVVRLGYRGQTYVLDLDDPNNQYCDPITQFINSNRVPATPTDPTAPLPPQSLNDSNGNPIGVPFQIFRQPIKTADPPAQLPDGAAVDWFFSGVDLAPFQPPPNPGPPRFPNPNTYPQKPNMFGALGTVTVGSPAPPPGPAVLPTPNTCGPVIVTFSPAGTLDQVYYSCSYAYYATTAPPTNTPFYYQARPLAGVYFLVGKIEKIQQGSGPVMYDANGTNDPRNLPNYQDPDCRWVAMTRQSGLVTTAEVASVPMFWTAGPTTNEKEWITIINEVMNSRRYASGNQSQGGQ